VKKPPYKAYRRKEEKQKPPVHLPEKVDTPEAEQLASDIYSVYQFLLSHWKKFAALVGLAIIIGGSFLGYRLYLSNLESKASLIVDKGIYFLNRGEEKKALQLFKEAVKEYPNAPSSKVAGFLLAKLEKDGKLLSKEAKLNDFLVSPPSKTSLAALKIDRKELQSAQKIISTARRDEDWTYPEALYEGLVISLLKGDKAAARNYLDRLKGDFGNLPITAVAERLLK
jgi:predicted negative regulator of RcsB-dependent stress response